MSTKNYREEFSFYWWFFVCAHSDHSIHQLNVAVVATDMQWVKRRNNNRNSASYLLSFWKEYTREREWNLKCLGSNSCIYRGHEEEKEKKKELKSRKRLYLHTWKHERETNHVRYAPMLLLLLLSIHDEFSLSGAFDSKRTICLRNNVKKKHKESYLISNYDGSSIWDHQSNKSSIKSVHIPWKFKGKKWKKFH